MAIINMSALSLCLLLTLVDIARGVKTVLVPADAIPNGLPSVEYPGTSWGFTEATSTTWYVSGWIFWYIVDPKDNKNIFMLKTGSFDFPITVSSSDSLDFAPIPMSSTLLPMRWYFFIIYPDSATGSTWFRWAVHGDSLSGASVAGLKTLDTTSATLKIPNSPGFSAFTFKLLNVVVSNEAMTEAGAGDLYANTKCYSGCQNHCSEPILMASVFCHCHAECNTCIGPDSTMCSSCPSGLALSSRWDGSCVCPEGQFPNPDTTHCTACDSSCKTCNGTSANQCTACGSYASLEGASPNTCACNPGYFPNPSIRSCSACFVTCLRCSASAEDKCTTCYTGASIVGGAAEGKCACSEGFYMISDARFCGGCDSTCKTCDGPQQFNCKTCKTGAVISDVQMPNGPGQTTTVHFCVCSDGYFPNTTSASCKACHVSCKTCVVTDANRCKSCFANATFAEIGAGEGTCTCTAPYLPTPDAAHCSLCHSTCNTCTDNSSNHCTACKTNASLFSGVSPGTCVCDLGFYPNTDSANCTSCHATCKACSLSGKSGCTSCYSTATLVNSASPGTCQCSDEFWLDTGARLCQPCDISCATCEDGVSCKTCRAHATVTSKLCVCDVGFYFDLPLKSCMPCHATCATCTGPKSMMCKSCKPTASLPQGASVGRCLCSLHFYPNPTSVECKQCNASCEESCIGPDAEDCVPLAVATFHEHSYARDSSLPYLAVSSRLICYRFPVPTNTDLGSLRLTGLSAKDSAAWSLSKRQCARNAIFEWPRIQKDFEHFFVFAFFPTDDLYLVQAAETVLRTWTMQFGDVMQLSTQWHRFTHFFRTCLDWTRVAGFANPPRYFDGAALQKFPEELEAWIAGGGTDYKIFNYWNGLSDACFSSSCVQAQAVTCCVSQVGCLSPCCQAFEAVKTSACSSS